MNSFPPATSQTRSQSSNEVLVNVIVKQDSNGRTVAIVPGLPELNVEASDTPKPFGQASPTESLRERITALAQLQQRIETHLAGAEIVSLPVKLPQKAQKNPWLEMAGIFKDDPQFDQMLEAIETYRRELDVNVGDDSPQK